MNNRRLILKEHILRRTGDLYVWSGQAGRYQLPGTHNKLIREPGVSNGNGKI
jgi:hypothetical protein